LRIGHRGAAALEPENTLRSFERAVELGVDFVEFDVLDLAGGTLVLAHSDDLLEVSHGAAAGRVRSLRLEALRELAPQLPTLDEALDFFAESNVGLHLDVKCRHRGRDLADALRGRGLVERTVASSFRGDTLRELRLEAPELALGVSYPDDRYGLARRQLLAPLVPATVDLLARAVPFRVPRWLEATGARVAMLHYAVLSRAVVQRCRARGAAVWTWTVNDPDLLDRVVELGVDGVISDDPTIFGG
jgi:glycerophosphoryl diester phosphodiesterase